MSSPVSSALPELPERSGAAVTGRWRAPRRLAAQALALQGLGLGLTLVAALVASHLQHRTRLADFNGHTRVLWSGCATCTTASISAGTSWRLPARPSCARARGSGCSPGCRG